MLNHNAERERERERERKRKRSASLGAASSSLPLPFFSLFSPLWVCSKAPFKQQMHCCENASSFISRTTTESEDELEMWRPIKMCELTHVRTPASF